MEITFHGAAGEVTGSCHLVKVRNLQILLDCGLIQGRAKDEKQEKLRKNLPQIPRVNLVK